LIAMGKPMFPRPTKPILENLNTVLKASCIEDMI
jgi:hypothetical protein